jgi:hypothetical protein
MTSRQMAHGAPSPAAGGSASTAAREAAPLPPRRPSPPIAPSADTTSAKRRHLPAAST